MKPLRHLSAAEVAAAMPPLPDRLDLAELTLRALGSGAEMPPKIGLHPRQAGSLAHAMPALLRGVSEDGSQDVIGAKWIAGFPANPGRGLATYHALVLLNDPVTGEPLAVMDGGTITAQRTAAISGAAIRHFRPESGGGVGASPRVAVLGAGAQARSHLPVIGHLLPGAEVRITDIDSDRTAALAAEATAIEGIGAAQSVSSVREAVELADVVISVVSFGPDRQSLNPDWLAPDVLFIAIDYDMQAPATLAREAYFVVDEREQFVAARSGPTFAGYPDPDATIGELLRGVGARPGGGEGDAGSGRPTGRVLVTHLGVGLADVVFASTILTRAEKLGLGRLLPR
jgi:ornithine cyclodeaminase/alanine dehydrogenase-like protein (mu-crystallin family)